VVSESIYDGKAFKPAPPISINDTTESERLGIFNRICPGIGREARFCIPNVEVEAALLQQGQHYSAYPKKFKRPDDSSVNYCQSITAVVHSHSPRWSV
jgi:hypothetical protein